MTLGLVCALMEELEHLRALLTDSATTVLANLRFDEGTLDGRRVVLAGSGMGKVNAAVVTTLLGTVSAAGPLSCRASRAASTRRFTSATS
jgi:nucleoside phosphorylase